MSYDRVREEPGQVKVTTNAHVLIIRGISVLGLSKF
jgi:hypothetical protein